MPTLGTTPKGVGDSALSRALARPRAGHPGDRLVTLPFEALGWCGELAEAAVRSGVSKRTLQRWRRSGVPLFAADDLCLALCGPAVLPWFPEVWGTAYHEAWALAEELMDAERLEELLAAELQVVA